MLTTVFFAIFEYGDDDDDCGHLDCRIIDHTSIDLKSRRTTLFTMLSAKLIYFFVIFIGSNLTAINGQFGFGGGPFFGGNSGGFNNQNTDFQQHRGGQFGVIAGFGSGGSSTSFNQNSGSGNYIHYSFFSIERNFF